MTPAFTDAERGGALERSESLRLLLIALAGVVLFHGGLLPFTHANTYDAFIHMFFGDSYHRSWFDPWEPRWYTGFSTTSYPPGTHMTIAALMYVMPLRAAFVVVQIFALCLLTIGVYRFSLIWVSARSAGYASIALVLSSAVSETVHLFGQAPTTLSLGIFLNGLPYVYRWVVAGRATDFAAAIVFTGATTAAHHVTTIFGGILFILPIGLQALRAVSDIEGSRHIRVFLAPLGRGLVLAVFMLIVVFVTVFPYWIWSINDPITQVPIPHGSRENFLARPDLGFVFFLLPWGPTLFLLPYVALKTFTSRLFPLGLSVLLCFVLGTGGTTPIPRAVLHGAFDILTLDRFTFWATILVLPFVGFFFDGLLNGKSGEAVKAAVGQGFYRLIVGGIFLSMVSAAVFAAILPKIQPTQPDFIDPTPIVRFLEQDEHDRWRYLTLGFGDQFAYLSAQTEAQSIDGNYHSARRLPDMTRFSVERLENSKYLGVPGLGSLRQFLVNADRYHLKYIFSNDDFYDPLLHFTGWVRLNRLANGVTVWEKPDVTALPEIQPRRAMPALHMLAWGLLPPLMLCGAGLIFVYGAIRRGFGSQTGELRPLARHATPVNRPGTIRAIAAVAAAVFLVTLAGGATWLLRDASDPDDPQAVMSEYFDNLDFRRFEDAYRQLDPVSRPDFETVMFNWRWKGGLTASYGKLLEAELTELSRSGSVINWQARLSWLTPLGARDETLRLQTVRRGDEWFLSPTSLRPTQTPARLQRGSDTAWNVVGRRQPRHETDIHRDRLDRPRIWLDGLRLVERGGRYSVIGMVTNADPDPAMVSLFSELADEDATFSRQAAGEVNAQRLLPAETAGFRVDFEGVLSLDDAAAHGGFDPTLFIPPELPHVPSDARIEARALVHGSDLYRGVALNGLSVRAVSGRPVIEATAVNTGTEVATIVRVLVLLYDTGGQPVWAEAGYVETNIYPGQSAPFRMDFPARNEIRVIADLNPETFLVNGSSQEVDLAAPYSGQGTIPLDLPGYSAMRVHVSAMTYDPLF